MNCQKKTHRGPLGVPKTLRPLVISWETPPSNPEEAPVRLHPPEAALWQGGGRPHMPAPTAKRRALRGGAEPMGREAGLGCFNPGPPTPFSRAEPAGFLRRGSFVNFALRRRGSVPHRGPPRSPRKRGIFWRLGRPQ